MNIKKLYLSLITAGVLAALSSATPAYALSNYTLNGNYVITGDLYVDSILGHVGQCLEVGTGPLGASEIVATGSPCGGGGGGGVSSVTAGHSGNITVAPTTGAVIVDEINDPTFVGVVTAAGFTTASDVQAYTGTFTGNLEGGLLIGDALVNGQCVQAGFGGQLVSSGAACGGGGGGVSSVTNTDGNLAIAPTTGAVVANLSSSVSILNNLTVGSGGGATDLETDTTNTGSLTVDGVLNGAGGITFFGAGASVPVCTNGSSQLTTTGCSGGGGVTSVTAGPSGNLTFAPTTGAVVGDITESPTFTGLTSLGAGGGFTNFNLQLNSNFGYVQIGNDYPTAVNGVVQDCLAVDLPAYSRNLLGLDCNGDLGLSGELVATSVTANNLASSVGQGVAIGTNGQLIPSGFTSVQQLHGNQSITAVAAACTPGTPIVFAGTFSAVPDIIMSTSAVVGDTAAPETGTITTTGFTPEQCSVASAATATVYWQAVN